MKKYYLLLFASVLALGFTACNDDDDDKKDPSGTFVANVTRSALCDLKIPVDAKSKYAPASVRGNFCWNTPDDIYVGTVDTYSTEVEVDGYWYWFNCDADICSVGKVSGLRAVRKVPSSGWVEKLACEEETGYVVRIKYYTDVRFVDGKFSETVEAVKPGDPDYVEGVVYARFYVEDHLENAQDEHTGMKIKIQYPFEPK